MRSCRRVLLISFVLAEWGCTCHYRSASFLRFHPLAHQYRDIRASSARRWICRDRQSHIEIWVYGIGHSSMAGHELLSQGPCATHLQASLLFRSVINTSSNDVPSSIHIRQETTESRTSSSQCELSISSST